MPIGQDNAGLPAPLCKQHTPETLAANLAWTEHRQREAKERLKRERERERESTKS